MKFTDKMITRILYNDGFVKRKESEIVWHLDEDGSLECGYWHNEGFVPEEDKYRIELTDLLADDWRVIDFGGMAVADVLKSINTKEIYRHIGKREVLEQLAEECAELGKSALKLIRAKYSNNWTPVEYYKARNSLMSEACDVITCLDVLGARRELEKEGLLDAEIGLNITRWATRLKEHDKRRDT